MKSLFQFGLALTLVMSMQTKPSFAITYNYVGNPYTTFDLPIDPSLGTFLAGSITFDSMAVPADGSYLLTDALILKFNLQSGVYNFSGTSFLTALDPVPSFVEISGGQITSWHINLFNEIGSCCGRHAGFNLGSFNTTTESVDYAAQLFNFAPSHGNYRYTAPGVWSQVVPAPAALPLLASGLGALGFIGWRRKRKEKLAAA